MTTPEEQRSNQSVVGYGVGIIAMSTYVTTYTQSVIAQAPLNGLLSLPAALLMMCVYAAAATGCLAGYGRWGHRGMGLLAAIYLVGAFILGFLVTVNYGS